MSPDRTSAVCEASSSFSWHVELPHSAVAVPMARALVRSALAELEGPTDRDTAELLTAELVTNAVEHTTGEEPIELFLEMRPSGDCQVEVHDRATPTPDFSDHGSGVPDVWQEYGRGLLLIRTLSSACGYRLTEQGKAVWFNLAVH